MVRDTSVAASMARSAMPGCEVDCGISVLKCATSRLIMCGGGRYLWLSARALVLNSGSHDLWLSATGAVVEDLLFRLNEEQGITLVIVTHDEELAEDRKSVV